MSGLREIHVTDDLTIRLNDTQLEARSPGGTWQPLTLSLIPRSYRLALADLLLHPHEEETSKDSHAPACRIFSGGICTCAAGFTPIPVNRTAEGEPIFDSTAEPTQEAGGLLSRDDSPWPVDSRAHAPISG